MKKLLTLAALVLACAVPARAGQYYGNTFDGSSTTMNLAGRIWAADPAAPWAPTIILNGKSGGVVTAGSFVGPLTGNVTGTVTTNANLTGPVTSVGNATSIPGPIPQAAVNLSTVPSAGSCALPNVVTALNAGAAPTCGQPSNVTGTAANVTGTVAVANGGTGATTAATARANLSAAQSGANADIGSMAGAGAGILISTVVTVSGSSLTVTGAGGLGVTYGVTAGSVTASNISLFQPTSGISRIQVNSPGNVVGLRLDADQGNGAAFVGTVSNQPLTFIANGSGAMTVASGGNVGIGTANPGTKLHMSSGIFTIDGTAPEIEVGGGAHLNITGVSVGNGSTLSINDSSQNQALQENVSGGVASISGSYFGAGPYPDIAIKTSAVDRIHVTSGGNVGIGTTSPATTLDVNGSAQFGSGATKSTFTATGALLVPNGAAVGVYAGANPIPAKGAIISGPVGLGTPTPQNALDVAGGAAMGTFGGVNGAPANGLIVSGSVGIGTAGPLSKLDVNGGVAIGTYAGANAAPSNGLIVSGSVGVSSANPQGLFTVGTSTGVIIDKYGHRLTYGPAPLISSCGTSPSIVGDDASGVVTVGTSAGTTCTLTFQAPYQGTVTCRVSNSCALITGISSASTTGVQFGASAALSSCLLYYDCSAHITP